MYIIRPVHFIVTGLTKTQYLLIYLILTIWGGGNGKDPKNLCPKNVEGMLT